MPWLETVRARGASPEPVQDLYDVEFPAAYYLPRIALHRRGAWLWWSVRKRLLQAARQHGTEVVMSYWAHPDGEVALRLARRLGIPAVLMVGGSDVLVLTDDPPLRRRIEAVLRGVDAVLAIGDNLREKVIAMGVSPSRVTSVLRPVDTSRFSPAG